MGNVGCVSERRFSQHNRLIQYLIPKQLVESRLGDEVDVPPEKAFKTPCPCVTSSTSSRFSCKMSMIVMHILVSKIHLTGSLHKLELTRHSSLVLFEHSASMPSSLAVVGRRKLNPCEGTGLPGGWLNRYSLQYATYYNNVSYVTEFLLE